MYLYLLFLLNNIANNMMRFNPFLGSISVFLCSKLTICITVLHHTGNHNLDRRKKLNLNIILHLA